MKKNQEFDVGKHSGKLRKTFLTMKLSLCFLIMGTIDRNDRLSFRVQQ